MLSVRTTAVCAPAFAYVTVYIMLLFVINVLNSSFTFPVTEAGFIVIPVM